MLTHPTLEKLRAMRLTGMAAALEEQLNAPDTHDLDFEERPGLLVDREMTVRHNRRLHTRLKQANFHQPAAWEDIDLKIDDWGIASVDENAQRDLLEILEDRFNMRSTIVTSQLPISQWHEYLGEATTLADAILDRLVHNAYKLELRGESMRKTRNALTEPTT